MISQVVLICLGLFAVTQGQLVNYNVANLCAQYAWPNGNFPHPFDCRKYLTCNGGATFEMSCPAGLAFNGNSRNCDNYANVALCQYNAPNYPVVVNNVCATWGWGNGNFYHPYDCSKYVQCANGVTTIMSCPPGLFYDPSIKTCSAAGAGYCRQYVFVPPVLNPAYPANYNNYCAANNLASGIHPDPYSCFSYVECTFGRTTHMPCPTGLAFNKNLLVCDDQRNVDCVGGYLVGKK